MAVRVEPLTEDRFDDFAQVVNRTRRPTHCWCLSHRLQPAQIQELGGGSRELAMRRLSARPRSPGVVAYRDGEPVGWCSIGPRSDIPRLAGSKLITPVDDVPVWSIICVVVRSGFRRQGVALDMVRAATEYAFAQGAPAVESYPADVEGRIDLTAAFIGTRKLFADAGFRFVGTAKALAQGRPRVIMRRQPDH